MKIKIPQIEDGNYPDLPRRISMRSLGDKKRITTPPLITYIHEGNDGKPAA
jgi:hypothetical protein